MSVCGRESNEEVEYLKMTHRKRIFKMSKWNRKLLIAMLFCLSMACAGFGVRCLALAYWPASRAVLEATWVGWLTIPLLGFLVLFLLARRWGGEVDERLKQELSESLSEVRGRLAEQQKRARIIKGMLDLADKLGMHGYSTSFQEDAVYIRPVRRSDGSQLEYKLSKAKSGMPDRVDLTMLVDGKLIRCFEDLDLDNPPVIHTMGELS